MNQRSTSVTRKFKTDLHDQINLDKKSSKAIREKRQSIYKMITPRVRGYKASNYNIKTQDKYSSAHQPQLQKPKVLEIDQQFVREFQQKSIDSYCVNHKKKVGSFESIHDRNTYYCYECAINLVKMNAKVNKITPQTQIIKLFLEEQLQKVAQVQQRIHEKISQHYLSLKQALLDYYVQAHSSIDSTKTISFAHFEHKQEHFKRIQELLGNMEECQIKFTTEDKKENMSHKHINIIITEQEINQKLSKERLASTRNQNPNQSLQIYNEKNSSIIKDRQYSYYQKTQKAQHQKKVKNEYKKSVYMR